MEYKSEEVTQGLIDEILPLLMLHEKELNVSGRPLDPDYLTYIVADVKRQLAVYTVRDGEEKSVIGYAVYWLSRHPHYDIKVAQQDILFLHPAHRKGRVGIKLIKFSEKCLKEDHSVEMVLQHTKSHKSLESLFQYLGYTELETIYSKVL